MNIIVRILFISFLWSIMTACDKNEDVNLQKQLNKFRAKEINGHNAIFGDFKIILEYQKNILNKGFIMNASKDTIGRLDDFQVLLKVPALTSDEIAALPEGSIVPTRFEPIFQIVKSAKKEMIYHYENIDNHYKFDYVETYLYESNDTLSLNPKVIKWRHLGDIEDGELMGRMIYFYDGNRIVSGDYAFYNKNWELFSHDVYEYNGDRLISIIGYSSDEQIISEKKFVYEGNLLKIITQEDNEVKEVIYTFNAEGDVSRIDEGDGNYMEIKYESGHGDFSNLTSLAKRLQGEPYIK